MAKKYTCKLSISPKQFCDSDTNFVSVLKMMLWESHSYKTNEDWIPEEHGDKHLFSVSETISVCVPATAMHSGIESQELRDTASSPLMDMGLANDLCSGPQTAELINTYNMSFKS